MRIGRCDTGSGIVSDRRGTWTRVALGLWCLVGAGGGSGSDSGGVRCWAWSFAAAQRNVRLAEVSQVADLGFNLLHGAAAAAANLNEWAIRDEVMIWHRRFSPLLLRRVLRKLAHVTGTKPGRVIVGEEWVSQPARCAPALPGAAFPKVPEVQKVLSKTSAERGRSQRGCGGRVGVSVRESRECRCADSTGKRRICRRSSRHSSLESQFAKHDSGIKSPSWGGGLKVGCCYFKL